jgi:hypothetical protein
MWSREAAREVFDAAEEVFGSAVAFWTQFFYPNEIAEGDP